MSTSTTLTLDGRRFDGVVLERGQASGDKETLVFERGRIRSSACDPYGYGDGAYTTRLCADGKALAFEAETESPQYGQLRWRGRICDGRLDGALTMVRDGQVVGEKWVVAAEVNAGST